MWRPEVVLDNLGGQGIMMSLQETRVREKMRTGQRPGRRRDRDT